MEILYRLAIVSDWDKLRDFRNKYSREPGDSDRKHFQQDFEESENKNQGVLFVALCENKIVGYGRCGYFDPTNDKPLYGLLEDLPPGYYLKGVLTDESVRGCGVGRHLTYLRDNWVKERSDRIYCVLQNTNIPSLKMHEAIGYKITKHNLQYQKIPNDSSGLLLEKLL